MISKTAKIHPLALIEEGVSIGDETHVGPFCIVRSGARIGHGCKLTAYCEIRENVVVGDGTSFGSRCTISANAIIGCNVLIKYGFVLTDTPDLTRDSEKVVGQIEDNVLIGANVTLMPGVRVGKGAIIGACSQVRSHVTPNQVWYGNPAKFIKTVSRV